MNGGAAVDPVSRETGDKNRRQPDRADRTIASAAIRRARRDRSRLRAAAAKGPNGKSDEREGQSSSDGTSLKPPRGSDRFVTIFEPGS